MNSHILIYSRHPVSHSPTLREITRLSNDNVSIVNHIDEFKTLLQKIPYRIILICEEDSMQTEMIRFIKSCKNISFQRNVILLVWFTKYNPQGIRQALMAGASQIFLNPIRTALILEDIKSFLQNNHFEFQTGKLKTIPPVTADLQIYGRIGQIPDPAKPDDSSLWRLESNVFIPDADPVQMNHRIHPEGHITNTQVRVTHSDTKNLFYRYANVLYISAPKFAFPKMKPEHFTHPKIKILWLSPWKDISQDTLFSKKIFSVYSSDYSIKKDDLDIISPQILILEKAPDPMPEQISDWTDSASDQLKAIFTLQKNLKSEKLIPCTENLSLAEQVIIYHKKDPTRFHSDKINQPLYIRRESIYSRFFFNFSGKITGVSTRGIRINSPVKIANNAILRIAAGAGKNHRAFSLYVRTTSYRKLKRNLFEITCVTVPYTKNINYLIPDLFHDHLETAHINENLSVVPTYLRRKTERKQIYLTVLLIIFFLIAVAWLLPSERINLPINSFSSFSEVAESIRKAFK